MNNQFILSDHVQNVQVLRPGNLLNEFVNREILSATQSKIEKGFTNFVIDMSDVQFINSVGLNLLIILKEKLKVKGGKVAVANASGKVVQLLEMTKLRPLFLLTASVEEAVEYFDRA